MTNIINEIARQQQVQAALSSFRDRIEEVVDLAIAIQQLPAPTFNEARRAEFVQTHFEVAGLCDVEQDELHNVYGRYATESTANSPPVIVSAHTDTVFPMGTDLTVRRENSYVYGPGLGDNSTGVAGLLFLAQTLRTSGLPLPANVWFVANVAEEGLGNLQGMKAVVQRFGPKATYIVVEGGLYGQISHQAIGVRRFRIEVEAQGGHSWGSFGNTSAVHELGRIINAIANLQVPQEPKTTYNVGVIDGGMSINTIAQSASLLLDLRSEDEGCLKQLVEHVTALVERASDQPDVTTSMQLIGNRPSGRISRYTPLITWAREALQYVGCPQVEYMTSSTDANIPLSQGMTAVCVGLTVSGNTHRLDEFMDPTYLPQGLGQLLLLVLAAAGYLAD
jgi:tripeptide aminopeptidase